MNKQIGITINREEMKKIMAGSGGSGCNGKTCEITSGCFDGGTQFSWCNDIPREEQLGGKCLGGFCVPSIHP